MNFSQVPPHPAEHARPANPFRRRLLAGLAALPGARALGAVNAGTAAPDSKFFQSSDGLRLHYLEAGSGSRTLVFVPGWLMPAAIFEAQLTGLSHDFRVLAFDPRSQGRSQVYAGKHSPERRTQDLAELLAAADVGEFVLAGWSLGVLEGLDFVARHQPPHLKGLVLIDNSIGEASPPVASAASMKAGAGSAGGAAARSREQYLRDFCAGLYQRPPPAALADAVVASALRVPPAAAQELRAQPYPRTYWRDIVAAQKVPVLYAIRPRLKAQGAALLARKPPGMAQVEVFETAGHALFVDEARRFNELVSRFARQVMPPDQ